MQKELITWQFILQSLEKGVAVVLLYVTDSTGSSPGRQGFLMAVNTVGQISGSIGGGIMEHKFVEFARRKLQECDHTASLHRQIHDKSALHNQSGMICSGEQTILLYPLKNDDYNNVQSLVESLQKAKNGTLSLSLHAITFSDDIPTDSFSLKGIAEDFLLTVKTGYKQRLFIIGAGHCSLAFARLMNKMDFYITLYENRSVLNSFEQNHYAHEKIWLKEYGEIAQLIEAGADNYVVIMTNGYRGDDEALRALIYKNFAYLGVLGSSGKIDQLFAKYIAEGISTELLARIHAPAGISIKSQTPEEIAISIAAEIIKVKNSHLK